MSSALVEMSARLRQRRIRLGEFCFRLALHLCVVIALTVLVTLVLYTVYKGWNRSDARR